MLCTVGPLLVLNIPCLSDNRHCQSCCSNCSSVLYTCLCFSNLIAWGSTCSSLWQLAYLPLMKEEVIRTQGLHQGDLTRYVHLGCRQGFAICPNSSTMAYAWKLTCSCGWDFRIFANHPCALFVAMLFIMNDTVEAEGRRVCPLGYCGKLQGIWVDMGTEWCDWGKCDSNPVPSIDGYLHDLVSCSLARYLMLGNAEAPGCLDCTFDL